jgi:hypothetical protein
MKSQKIIIILGDFWPNSAFIYREPAIKKKRKRQFKKELREKGRKSDNF